MKLRAIAHSRTGDKGNTSNVSVIAFDERDFPLLARHVTAERVRSHLGAIVQGEVTRYELPGIGALNFVLHGALGGGVTRSLALDPHGKSLSSALLDLDIPDGEQAFGLRRPDPSNS
jgi:hypothetical protein